MHRRPWPFRFVAGGASGAGGSTGVGTSASGTVDPVEEGRAFDPLAAAAERDLHEAMDVGLLRFDLFAKFGHHAAEFRDHGFRVGQLLAKVVGVVGRRHAGFNTAPRSG